MRRRKRNPINPVNGHKPAGDSFTPAHIKRLQDEFDNLQTVDPEGPTFKKLRRYIAGLTIPLLNQIAGGKIKWLTYLARRELDARRTLNKNPIRRARSIHLASGKTRVRGRKRILAWSTTRARAGRQIRKLRAMRSGWKPRRGIPARDVRKKAARLGNETVAWRKGRKWSVLRGSVKSGKFQVLAKNLTDLELKKWYRGHGYTAKAL